MRIEWHAASELSATLQAILKERVNREFGAVPIVRDHVWADPTWVCLGFEGDTVVSFLNIIEREVLADIDLVQFFGLNNVITEPEHRGKGYSSELIKNALEFIRKTNPEGCGFLFCADDLVNFYSKLGWKRFEGVVTVMQPSGEKQWTSNAMSYDLLDGRSWNSVHLRGLPW